MNTCFFVSDLHGRVDRYNKLFARIERETPSSVFIGGDLLPSGLFSMLKGEDNHRDFVNDFLVPALIKIRERLADRYPRIFLILGNDDGRFEEEVFINAEKTGIWTYVHNRKIAFGDTTVYGYSYVPPTPFMLKDWERYDVSRYVDPGCISPENGRHSTSISKHKLKYSTIQKDLQHLAGHEDVTRSIFLFHTPPYKTRLDRVSNDGKMIDGVPLDLHVGSIAVQRFIESRQPLLTLHGHIHESATLSGSWRDSIGRTHMFSAAHEGPELALVRFDPANLDSASRELL
jgi:Icc-related predicted phosphoesterase